MKRNHFCNPSFLGIKNVSKLGKDRSRRVSFEELCPVWAEKLTTGLSEKDRVILARDSKYCIVGEAWQFSGKYTGYYFAPLIPFIGCWKCIMFGRRFGKKSRAKNIQRSELEPLITDFMTHWTEKHSQTYRQVNVKNDS